MYKGKRARFTSNALDSVADIARKIFVKYINPTNLVRLQKTLDLSDVGDEKPSINSVMIPIQTRLDEEYRQSELEMEQRLKDAWSRGMLYNCMGEDYMYDDEGIISAKLQEVVFKNAPDHIHQRNRCIQLVIFLPKS